MLIKVLLQSILMYIMSFFKPLQRLCSEIEAMFSRFGWSQLKKAKGIHWQRWDKLGMMKSKGGMGFRKLENFNRVMLAKQGWKILKDPQSLVARVYKEKYFKNSQLLKAPLGKSHSFIWRSVWLALDVLRRGLLGGWEMESQLRSRVRNGCQNQSLLVSSPKLGYSVLMLESTDR